MVELFNWMLLILFHDSFHTVGGGGLDNFEVLLLLLILGYWLLLEVWWTGSLNEHIGSFGLCDVCKKSMAKQCSILASERKKLVFMGY